MKAIRSMNETIDANPGRITISMSPFVDSSVRYYTKIKDAQAALSRILMCSQMAIGHTNIMLFDTGRPGGRPDFPEFAATGRPIPVSIWYPVDPSVVAGRNSDAEYPLDVLYGIAPPSTSADWEPYGIDPAYEAPVPSRAKPFPLVVVSPGWGGWNWIHTSIGTRLASHGFVVITSPSVVIIALLMRFSSSRILPLHE